MTISKPIEKAPTVKEDLLVVSETAAEEAQLELDQQIKCLGDGMKVYYLHNSTQ